MSVPPVAICCAQIWTDRSPRCRAIRRSTSRWQCWTEARRWLPTPGTVIASHAEGVAWQSEARTLVLGLQSLGTARRKAWLSAGRRGTGGQCRL